MTFDGQNYRPAKATRAARSEVWRKTKARLAPIGWAAKAVEGHRSGYGTIGYDVGRETTHRQHQQGDEIACSCGRRWPVGENHP